MQAEIESQEYLLFSQVLAPVQYHIVTPLWDAENIRRFVEGQSFMVEAT